MVIQNNAQKEFWIPFPMTQGHEQAAAQKINKSNYYYFLVSQKYYLVLVL